ncbi:MAG: hypothetical protein WC530_07940 [Candidatus Omnitrophota bacterium]|jgi:hypothetical protein
MSGKSSNPGNEAEIIKGINAILESNFRIESKLVEWERNISLLFQQSMMSQVPGTGPAGIGGDAMSMMTEFMRQNKPGATPTPDGNNQPGSVA